MNATLFGVLLAVFVTGVTLFLIGRRGRRLNDHPQCRDCGFDLQGVFPASSTCPECGSGLKRPRAVRNGVRKRMPAVAAAGVLIALLPVAPAAVMLYAAVTGTNIAKYTPTGVLLWQTRVSSPEVNKTIANELIDRLTKGVLDKAQSSAVAERALALQADRSSQWDAVWGDVIERINLNGDLSTAQEDRFRQQAVSLSGRTRGTVRPGDALPIIVKCAPGRVGSASQMLAMTYLESATLDGEAVRKPSTRGGSMFGGMGGSGPELYFYLYGAKTNSGWGTTPTQGQEQASSLIIPKGTRPGLKTLKVTVLSKVSDAQMGWSGERLKSGAPGVSTFTITQQVEVLAEGSDPIKRITPTPQVEKDMRTMLSQTTVNASVVANSGLFPIFGGGLSISRSVSAQLSVDSPPAPFAFEVFVRVRGKETRLGEIASSPTVTSGGGRGYMMMGMGGASPAFYLGAEVANLQRSDKTLDLIFRPSTKVAMATADLAEIYGGEIVLKDFAVTRNEVPGTESGQTEPGSEPELKTEPEPASKP